MTHDEMMTILRKAAAKLDIEVDIFSEGVHNIEEREDSWYYVSRLNCPGLEKTYDVWWHIERQEGWLWPCEQTGHGWTSLPLPLQASED
jgi:hypothetical protein